MAGYAAELEIRRDGAGDGRETIDHGPFDSSVGPQSQDLRDADAEERDGRLEPATAEDDGESRGDDEGHRAPISQEGSTGNGFYKSQEEVDRAFGRRLASERRRWERELKEKQLLSSADGKNANGEDTWLPEKGMYAGEYAYFADLVTQGAALSKEDDGFDLMSELKDNPAFERMIASGVPVSEAYEIVGLNRLAKKEQLIRSDERQRMMAEIENRTQSLPPIDHSPGMSSPALDVTRMSEEELTRLAERVRRGERVVI